MNELMTIQQACEYLNVSRTTFYRIVRRQEISLTKVGPNRRMTRIRKTELDFYLDRGTKGKRRR